MVMKDIQCMHLSASYTLMTDVLRFCDCQAIVFASKVVQQCPPVEPFIEPAFPTDQRPAKFIDISQTVLLVYE